MIHSRSYNWRHYCQTVILFFALTFILAPARNRQRPVLLTCRLFQFAAPLILLTRYQQGSTGSVFSVIY